MLNHYLLQAPTDLSENKKWLHHKFVRMTDLFYTLPIKPAHLIYLVADIGNDGIGDLQHLIRAYHVLNRAYPGKIKCIAFIFKSLQTMYEELARHHHVDIDFRDIKIQTTPANAGLNEDKLDLVIHLSLVAKHPRVFHANVRHYSLLEIQYHSPDIHQRHSTGHMGFLHQTEGMWIDEIPYGHDKPSLLFHASVGLKRLLGASYLRTEQGAKQWIEKAWISDAHYFEKNNFIFALIAQLQYIHAQALPIDQLIIKHVSKDRKGNPWQLAYTLSEKWLRDFLMKMNVNCIVSQDELIPISSSNRITLRLIDKHISHDDYPTFLQLVNGVSLPAGDNTYSEAWSNKNTRFPPLPELRDYKQASLAPLESVIDSLTIAEKKKNWLRDLIVFSQRMNIHAKEAEPAWLMTEGIRLGNHWADCDSPHETWVTFSSALAPHNLNHRLISIIKEQLCFAAHPELVQEKEQLLVSPDPAALQRYRDSVLQRLRAPCEAPLDLKTSID